MVWTGPDARGRLAKSLVTLFKQIDSSYDKNRNRISDGTVGDKAHEARRSEHNTRNTSTPGICRALDITNDPAHGLVSNDIARALIESRDPRIMYVISNGKIAASTVSPWQWRPYYGSNKHNLHFHVSVRDQPHFYDDPSPWNLSGVPVVKPEDRPPAKPVDPILSRGAKGQAVKELQELLGVKVDGVFGSATFAALKLFQSQHRIQVDGVAGPYTWAALRSRKPAEPINYHSLVDGGYFSATPYDRSIPTAIRTNNPGAVNGAEWEKQMPGYVTTSLTSPGNRTTIFLTPEHGVATYWELLRRYRERGLDTVGEIINQYGGGQDYSAYLRYVTDKTGLKPTDEIKLTGDDENLLKFAKAMFRYEAGKAIPWSDAQIMHGFNLARGLQA